MEARTAEVRDGTHALLHSADAEAGESGRNPKRIKSTPALPTTTVIETVSSVSTKSGTAVVTTSQRFVNALRLNSAFNVTARIPMAFCASIARKQSVAQMTSTFACTIIPCSAVYCDARPIVLLTAQPISEMPELPLRYEGKHTMPAPIAVPDGVTMSSEQRDAAYSYTLRILAFCALKAKYEAEHVPYLLLPALPNYTVDWDEIMACVDREDVIALSGSSILDSASDGDLGELQDRVVYQGTDWWNERPLCPIGLRSKSWLDRHDITPLLERQDGGPVPVSQKLSEDDLLLQVRSVPKQTDMRQLDRDAVLIRHGYVHPSYCYVGAMSASMLRSARMLPSIMTAYENILLARECNQTVFHGLLKNERSLQEALTTPSADAQFNYQRLEFLGDCILKLVASCVVYSKHGDLNEGGLTQKRQAVICNEHLRSVGVRCKLAEFATNQKTFPKRWLAHGTAPKISLVSRKMQADFVEAVLGAAWLDGGLASVLACCNALEIFDTPPITVESFRDLPNELATPKHGQVACEGVSDEWLMDVEKALGYRFRSPHLAKQALTHASMQDEPSYERLEFMGDAVLDICLVQWLHQLYGCQTEEGYSVLKGNAVANVSLAVACLSSDLPRLFRHHPATPIVSRFKIFRARVDNVCVPLPAAPPPARREVLPWHGIDDAPKQLADIIESTIGAVYVDAGFDLERARGVFNKLLVPHFLTYIHPDVLPLNLLPAVVLESKDA